MSITSDADVTVGTGVHPWDLPNSIVNYRRRSHTGSHYFGWMPQTQSERSVNSLVFYSTLAIFSLRCCATDEAEALPVTEAERCEKLHNNDEPCPQKIVIIRRQHTLQAYSTSIQHATCTQSLDTLANRNILKQHLISLLGVGQKFQLHVRLRHRFAMLG